MRITLELLDALPRALAARPQFGPLRWSLYSAAGRLPELADAERLRRQYLQTLASNTMRLAVAGRLLDAAESAGVPLLPLKGAVLAEALYCDVGVRPMADLDLAVRPTQVDAALALFAKQGFHRFFPDRRRFRPPFAHDVALTDGRQIVELHFRWLHELGVDSDTGPLFDRAIEIELLGRRRLVPSWDDHLLLVAAHAAGHVFGEHPLWVIDLALTVAQAGGFAVAAERARTVRAERAFAVAVTLAARALPGHLPSVQLPARGRRRARWLAPLLWPTLAAPPPRALSLAARSLMTDRATWALANLVAKARVKFEEWREPTDGFMSR